jgi:hypothetical protein
VTFNAKFRRRAFGSLCLIAAVVMLMVGETNPSPDTNRVAFVGYWIGCFGFAMLAMGAAILDLRAVRREARAAQRSLVEATLHNLQAEKQQREAGPWRKDANDLKD